MAKRGGKEALREEDKRKVNKQTLSELMGIFRFALPYKGWFIVGLVSLALSSVTLLAFPYLAGKLLDIASGKPVPYFSSIGQITLALLVVLFIQGIFSFIRVYTFAIVSERSLADVRKAVYQKIIWLPMSFFDSRRVGELMSRITSDVGTLSEMFAFTLAELLRQFLTLVFGVALIFYLAPKLTAFMLLTFPVLVVAALIFGKYIRKLSANTQDKLADANIIVEESLQSISVVKSFTNERFETSRYGNALGEVVKIAIRTARYRGLFISFIIFALFGGIVAVGWYGASLVQTGETTIGELFSFVIYTSFIGGSIAGLGDIYTQLQKAIGASERLLEILRENDELVTGNSPEFKLTGAIAFRDVSFSYPTRKEYQVLKALNFTIAPGEKVALVGQSGSGKSTIINLLMRFYPVDLGEISIDDVVSANYDLSRYRKNIGIVPRK